MGKEFKTEEIASSKPSRPVLGTASVVIVEEATRTVIADEMTEITGGLVAACKPLYRL